MRVTLLVSEWCSVCPAAERTWRQVNAEKDFDLEVLDVGQPEGRKLIADKLIKSVPATLVDGELKKVGPPSAEEARQLVAGHGANCGLVAKLERAEAVTDPAVLDAIILASDAVMVARGDLGVEVGDAPLMGLQKLIINRARALNRAVITATQMMESMTSARVGLGLVIMDSIIWVAVPML